MDIRRKKTSIVILGIFILISVLTSTFNHTVFADKFFHNSPYHSYSGDWIQKWHHGNGKGSHWTAYSVIKSDASRDVFASIKVKNFITETHNASYNARVESRHPSGPYETHKHNGGQNKWRSMS